MLRLLYEERWKSIWPICELSYVPTVQVDSLRRSRVDVSLSVSQHLTMMRYFYWRFDYRGTWIYGWNRWWQSFSMCRNAQVLTYLQKLGRKSYKTRQEIFERLFLFWKPWRCSRKQHLVPKTYISQLLHCRPDLTGPLTIAKPDWEVYCHKVADLIVAEQSPARVMEVRSKFYELLSHCIPPTVILKVVKPRTPSITCQLTWIYPDRCWASCRKSGWCSQGRNNALGSLLREFRHHFDLY